MCRARTLVAQFEPEGLRPARDTLMGHRAILRIARSRIADATRQLGSRVPRWLEAALNWYSRSKYEMDWSAILPGC